MTELQCAAPIRISAHLIGQGIKAHRKVSVSIGTSSQMASITFTHTNVMFCFKHKLKLSMACTCAARACVYPDGVSELRFQCNALGLPLGECHLLTECGVGDAFTQPYSPPV